MQGCTLCPRNCNVSRKNNNFGFCKSSYLPKVSRFSLHMWEEPCISGKNGSGTVFFSGCSLKCVFCQNYEISHQNKGEIISIERLSEIFLQLQNMGAHNINLVNPTHFSEGIKEALDLIKEKLEIPVVWNSSGYEKPEVIRSLSGYVDIFLPDFKYVTAEISRKYSGAEDYFEYAKKALREMIEIAGYPQFSPDGMMTKGVLIRHLVLPSHIRESFKVIDFLSENFDTEKLYLSLMCQYLPSYRACEYKEISRKLTTLEYRKVTDYAVGCGIKNGFLQERNSAAQEYIPQFFDKL
ncbi:MAG: radical SAM protein [Ruminococcaceae bacterium]|nr:radical SAM protein [Oscillospiraceae bacterium]